MKLMKCYCYIRFEINIQQDFILSMEILAVHDLDRSQGSLRDEYNQLLNKIESLATTREEEEDA